MYTCFSLCSSEHRHERTQPHTDMSLCSFMSVFLRMGGSAVACVFAAVRQYGGIAAVVAHSASVCATVESVPLLRQCHCGCKLCVCATVASVPLCVCTTVVLPCAWSCFCMVRGEWDTLKAVELSISLCRARSLISSLSHSLTLSAGDTHGAGHAWRWWSSLLHTYSICLFFSHSLTHTLSPQATQMEQDTVEAVELFSFLASDGEFMVWNPCMVGESGLPTLHLTDPSYLRCSSLPSFCPPFSCPIDTYPQST